MDLKQINMYSLTTQEGKYGESSQLNQTKSQIECQVYDNRVIFVPKIHLTPHQILLTLNLMSEHSYGLYALRVNTAHMSQPFLTYRPFYAYPKKKIGVERPLGYVYIR